MKIHSDFHDYYDVVRTYGADPLLHYDRKERSAYLSDTKTKIPYELLSRVRLSRNLPEAADVERLLIGFCGTVYPCIRLIHHDKSREHTYYPNKLNELFPLNVARSTRGFENRERRHRKDQRERAAWLTNRPRLDALFVELNAPIFAVQYDPDDHTVGLALNVPLRDFEFFRVFDPYSVFQEISMYLGNQLVGRDAPDEIEDKYRIAMHGYDERSFRHPTRVAHLSK